jgi:hypothetical protein
MNLFSPTKSRQLLPVLCLLMAVTITLTALNCCSVDAVLASWQTIFADNEYDLFVGASITPKTVSDRIYDALVFF